jgi:hypothetical protein
MFSGRCALRQSVANEKGNDRPTSRYDPPFTTRLMLPLCSVKEAYIMKLSARFMLDNLFILAAAFLVVISMAWSVGTASWTAFGVSTGITVIAAASAVLTTRNVRKFGHGLIGLAGLWSLVAALVFSGTVLTWLLFADAILVGALALGDLIAHEATTEKVVHQLVVQDAPKQERIAA